MSVAFQSALDDLQKALVHQLTSCGTIAASGIEVLGAEDGDIEAKIATTLAEGLGATIFVSEVELGGVSGDMANVSGDDSQFTVVMYTNPTVNNTGLNAAALREIVMRRLHLFQPVVAGAGVVTLMPDPESGRLKKATNIRNLTFRLSMSFEAGID